ncbi:MAG: recombinase family protein [Bacteriovorax sp.]|nr:recombinase family protein [Bacteriovorax sp.]
MIIGYARISTSDQNFALQLDALKKAGCEKVFKETVSGDKSEKKELEEALKRLRKGDTLVVWRLDRLGRSLRALIELANGLKEEGIYFQSLMDSIDTSTAIGQFFFHVTGSFAELERNLIIERTMAGLEAARKRGRKGGRPKAIDNKTFHTALKMHRSEDFSVNEICLRLKINRRSFYRYLQSSGDQ